MTKTCPVCNKDIRIFNAITIDPDEEIVVHTTCVSSYMGTEESLRFLMNLLYGDTEITYQIDNKTFASELDNTQVIRLTIKTQATDQENISIDQTNIISIVYAMAAAMIGADRRLDNEEIHVAQSEGLSRIEDFNKSDFRDYVSNIENENPPDFFEGARSLKGLNIEHKILIYNYLEAIAKGDGDFARQEIQLLDLLKSKRYWDLNIE